MLYSCITSSPLALAIRRAACVASHTAHAEACLSARQNFLATEFPVTPVRPALKSGTAMRTTVKSGTAPTFYAGPETSSCSDESMHDISGGSRGVSGVSGN